MKDIDLIEVKDCSISFDNLRLHYLESGTGPVILLVAGFPQSCYAWRKVIPLLANKYRVIALDLPGQGDSDKPPGGYDTQTTAERIHGFVEKLGLENFLYVGHDIGAWVGYAFGHLYASSLRGIVLLDANIPGVTLQDTITLGPDNWRNWHFLFNPIADLPEALLAGRERILIEWFFKNKALNYRDTFTELDLDEYTRVYSALGGMRGMLGYYRSVLEDMEQNRVFGQQLLKIPVLALGGDKGSAPDLHDRIKQLAIDVYGGHIKDSGHYIPEEQPLALVEEIIEFDRIVSEKLPQSW
ncbi:alpha/beta fold hydrolase [Pedobacter petrophilus]|uniref:Alpha/beta fold hydrolase n=3 Tax=Pedobacter TaxID=84567 RepID=A0A7K0G4Y2_9SPHI|nr:alpha/beta fold hydrolase [Pedobacter petrophilus]